MNNGNQTPLLDKKLMKQAKERVETRSFLKWMFGLGVILSIGKTVVWFIKEDRGVFWPGYFMAGWAVMLVILCVIFIPSLSSKSKSSKKVMDEYEKLKKEKDV